MNNNFYIPDYSDLRIKYSQDELTSRGYSVCNNREDADFVLLGVNPDKQLIYGDKPIFAGNISGENIIDYTKNESFALKNAYLTAEAAIALAVCSSSISMINSSVLLLGYGRISKAMHKYISQLTNNITVCARSKSQRDLAECNSAKVIDFQQLTTPNDYDYIFNTVAHPVLNDKELSYVNSDALVIDLASFPGGVDNHSAKARGVNLICARGLPAKYSPKTAGIIVADTVDSLIKEGLI